MTITALPTAPSRNDDAANFSAKADAWVLALEDWTTEVNALSSDLAGLETAAPAITAIANFAGTWNSGTSYTVPKSVYYSSRIWLALQSSTNQTPADGSAYWAPLDFYHSLTVTAVSALDVDCRVGNYFTKTITTGTNTFTFSNAPSGRAYSFTLELTHTGGTAAWPGSVVWPENTAPTLTSGKVHVLTFLTSDGGTKWRGSYLANYTS